MNYNTDSNAVKILRIGKRNYHNNSFVDLPTMFVPEVGSGTFINVSFTGEASASLESIIDYRDEVCGQLNIGAEAISINLLLYLHDCQAYLCIFIPSPSYQCN